MMKLRTKYILFVVLIHAVALFMSYLIFEKSRILFILVEMAVLCSVWISLQLYNQMIRPLNMLARGTDTIREGDFNVTLLDTGMEEMDQLVRVYNQMLTALREERTKQQQQHFFLDKLILNSPVGIIVLDHDNRITQVNPAARKLLNSLTVEGWLLDDIAHPVFECVRTLIREKGSKMTIPGAAMYKIQLSAFIDRGFVRHFVLVEEMTTELLEAEKAAYGKVIRMMAHEVNNTVGPVNSILQSASSLQQETGKTSLSHALQVALDRNNNLNRFMRNLADVVRLPEPVKKPVILQQLVKRVSQLFRKAAEDKNVRLSCQFAEAPVEFFADELQMEQVLINIVKNALEAIGDSGAGEITFVINSSPKALLIRDTGRGIGSDTAPKLFTPFFSTKANGQGIGLTLIKDILIQHGFHYRLGANQAGQTEFLIALERTLEP